MEVHHCNIHKTYPGNLKIMNISQEMHRALNQRCFASFLLVNSVNQYYQKNCVFREKSM